MGSAPRQDSLACVVSLSCLVCVLLFLLLSALRLVLPVLSPEMLCCRCHRPPLSCCCLPYLKQDGCAPCECRVSSRTHLEIVGWDGDTRCWRVGVPAPSHVRFSCSSLHKKEKTCEKGAGSVRDIKGKRRLRSHHSLTVRSPALQITTGKVISGYRGGGRRSTQQQEARRMGGQGLRKARLSKLQGKR